MKARAITAALLLLALLFSFGCSHTPDEDDAPPKTIEFPNALGHAVSFAAYENGYFYRRVSDTEGELLYIKGVDIGLTQPTTDLSEADVSRETFDRWLEMIGEMNANCVRVFTLMNPDFYEALFAYNTAHADSPLCLFQGIWFPEELLEEPGDALDTPETVRNAFGLGVTETLDAIHGSGSMMYGSSKAVYSTDVSEYVVGYILGLEYPAEFVKRTNDLHPSETEYAGKYLKTLSGASPFETFLCGVGDALVEYETSRFARQTPVAFLNWQALDTLTHSAEPFAEEADSVYVDTEKIVPTSSYAPGLFAAYDVYPYYPEFMNFQKEYVEAEGEDNFSAYLRELRASHKVPLLVAEYGLSTSRGVAHDGACGYTQGGMSEKEAARLLVRMTESIKNTRCAGGLIFEWSDEWFKSTWNEVSYEPKDSSMRTHDLGSAEQSFGLICYEAFSAVPDGDTSEWTKDTGLEHARVCVKYDADYMHLLVSLPDGFDFENDTYYVPISVTGEGSDHYKDMTFSENVDYLLVIHGKDDTRLLCDAYRDVFHFRQVYLRGIYGKNEKKTAPMNSGVYDPIRMLTANGMYLPVDGVSRDPQTVETGLLRYGTADRSSPEFDSLADFCASGSKLEIRIAWYLLGVVNAREKKCIGPLTGDGVTFADFDSIFVGAGTDGAIVLDDAQFTTLPAPSLRERTKAAYDAVKDSFATLGFY